MSLGLAFKLPMPLKTRGRAASAVLLTGIVVVALALGLVLHLVIGTTGGTERFPISWFVIAAAILGSAVNQPFRQTELRRSAVPWVLGYVVWKCLVAVVFAFVLYLMIIADLLSGDLFPRFTNTTLDAGGAYVDMASFVTAIKPQAYQDVAKLLVWSFLAGYSEKFVPNLLAKIANSAANTSGTGKIRG